MNRKLVFWTAFNSYQTSKLLRNKPAGTIHPVQTPEWTKRRVELFVNYNLPSIMNQTHQDFLYIILLDPELKHLTDAYLPKNLDSRIVYCYEDGPTLDMLKQYDEIVYALIDNDDMYSHAAGGIMMACPAEWMYFKHGYALDIYRGKFRHYDTIGSGPFFAHRMNPKTMIRFDRDKRHPTHKAVIELKPRELPPGQFCVLLHEKNTSSHSQMRYVLGPVKNGKEILLRNFSFKRGAR